MAVCWKAQTSALSEKGANWTRAVFCMVHLIFREAWSSDQGSFAFCCEFSVYICALEGTVNQIRSTLIGPAKQKGTEQHGTKSTIQRPNTQALTQSCRSELWAYVEKVQWRCKWRYAAFRRMIHFFILFI